MVMVPMVGLTKFVNGGRNVKSGCIACQVFEVLANYDVTLSTQ